MILNKTLVQKVMFISVLVFFLSGATELTAKSVLRTSLDEFPPWMMQQPNGEFSGAEVDIIKAIGKKLGLRVQFESYPFKRGLKCMKEGSLDLMIGVLKRPDRELYIDFIFPPYKTKSNKVFYVLPENIHLIKNYEDLYGLTVGLRIGARYYPRFDNDTCLIKSFVTSDALNIKKLLTKRIDTFVTTDSLGDYLIKQANAQNKIKKAPYGYFKKNNVFIGISKNSSLIRKQGKRIRTVIRGMIQNGEVEQIISDYFKRNELRLPVYK